MNATATAQGTIEHLDPQSLILEPNVRPLASIDKEFVESIRQAGVLVPVLGYRDENGVVNVRAGQRRMRAAQEAGLATMPVYVVDAPQSERDRIIEQLIENEQRLDLNEVDRIAAWKQLELDGMSVTQIAKRVGAKRERVKTGLAVAASDTGTSLISEQGLTLDQAAELLLFEDDPETVARLTKTAIDDPGYFPFALERAKNDRTDRANKAQAEQEAAEAGYQVLAEYPESGTAPHPIQRLTKDDGERVTAEDVKGLTGISAYVYIDWNHQVVTCYYVEDPAAHGFTITTIPGEKAKGPMTDEQKAERKQLIANNKEWDAAETVRRQWLAQLIARKTLPKDAVKMIAESLTHSTQLVAASMSDGNAQAKELLGLKRDYTAKLEAYLEKHPSKALHVALAVALGGIEQTTSRNTWRYPDARTARYLNTLAAWGYTLSPVETLAATTK